MRTGHARSIFSGSKISQWLPGVLVGEQDLGSSSSPPGQSCLPSHFCSGQMVTAELAQGIRFSQRTRELSTSFVMPRLSSVSLDKIIKTKHKPCYL